MLDDASVRQGKYHKQKWNGKYLSIFLISFLNHLLFPTLLLCEFLVAAGN